MCGINGIYNYGGAQRHDLVGWIMKMNDALAHRGPDDHGIWMSPENRLVFGHRRLSILDLSNAGHQPMVSRVGHVISFNGEIYNYRQLREELLPEYAFKSNGDTETLLALYERFGSDFLQHVNGMFAFAIWDAKTEQLFLARDRSGKKPLYYSSGHGVFVFSSEIKAMLKLPWISADLDDQALYHFLTFKNCPPPYTLFKGIHKLEPGTRMHIGRDGSVSREQYWKVRYRDLRGLSESESCDLVYRELDQSVNRRLVSDVPVGAFLSGGVDSSAVVALMRDRTEKEIKTFSIGFENQPGYDELPHARRVSRLFNTSHHEKIVTAREFFEFLPRIVQVFDEPLADAAAIPIYFISRLAAEQDIKVVMSGDGADELFAGYRNYQKYIRLYPFYRHCIRAPGAVKKPALALLRRFDRTSLLCEMLNRAALNQDFFWAGASSYKQSYKSDFLSESYLARLGDLDSHQIISAYRREFEDHRSECPWLDDLDWMCYLGYRFVDAERYLMRADRLGMACSVELRAPFLDYHFVEQALSLPSVYKVKNSIPKYILKKSLEPLLPADLLYRPKRGFCVPLREWAGGYMADYVEDHAAGFCRRYDLFSRAGIEAQVLRIKSGRLRKVNDLWMLYFLMQWFERWL